MVCLHAMFARRARCTILQQKVKITIATENAME